jgi:ABC-type branched-subunit amino acid transport system substrate-binding protein
MMWRRTGAVLLMVGALTAAGCSTKDSGSSGGGGSGGSAKTAEGVKGNEITLGVLTDQTGIFAATGKDVTNGQQLFWDNQNTKGGVCGKTVKLQIEDSGYNVQKAVQQYASLKNDSLAFQQLLGSAISNALTQQTQADKIVAIPEAWASSLTDNPYYAVVGSTYDVEMVNGIDYMLEKGIIKQGDTVAHIFHDSEYGENGAAGSRFMQSQGKIKLVEQKIPQIGDPSAQVAAIKADPNVKAVLVTISPLQLPAVAQGLDLPIMGNNPSFAPGLLSGPAGDAIAKNYQSAIPFVNWDDPPAAEVKNLYSQKFGMPLPSAGAIHGYATGQAMYEILNKACQNGDLTREGVFNAKQSLSAVNTGGLVAPLNYTKVGEPPTRTVNISKADKAAPGGSATVQLQYKGPDADAYKRG